MKKKLISFLTAVVMLLSMATVQIPASAEDFELSSSKMLAPNDLATLNKDATFDGKSVVECNSEGKTAAVRYDNLYMGPAYSADNRYLLIDCYYQKSSATTPYGMSVLFRSNGTDTDDWNNIYKEPDSVKKPSSGLTALPNRWETVAIDCQSAMNYLSSNNLTQKQLQIEIPATTGTDRFYISSVRFSDSTGDFEIGRRATIMSSNDLMSSPEIVSFNGEADVQKFSVTSSAHTVRYGGIHMGHAFASSNRYMLIDCYLDDANLTEFDITTVFRNVNNGATWINGNASSTKKSGTYATGKWVTAIIDCEEPLKSLATNKQSLTQLQISIPATTADFYVKSVRFAAAEPAVQYVYEDETGAKYTYLSEDGIVTVDGENLPAYTTTTDAFNGLGEEGGTIYLEGELNAFTDVASRGPIILRGIGDTEEDIANNAINGIDVKVKGGDITFDYLTVNPVIGAETDVNYASFYTDTQSKYGMGITIGANVVSTGIAIGSKHDNDDIRYPFSDKVTINGGYFYSVTPLTNYGARRLKRNGSIDYTINGGEINALFAGSNNSWEWEQSEIRGDVKYTINDGLFTNYMTMGSAFGSSNIYGNIIWTINGGWMQDRRIVGGNIAAAKMADKQQVLKNVAAIVNQKGKNEGFKNLTLGTDNAKGRDIGGNEIYILNNNEDNVGTKIANGSLAEYKMHVYYGKAEPIFAKDQTQAIAGSTHYYGGNLKGFALTADEEGAVPYLNGVALTPNAEGYYEIAADANNIMEIVFTKNADSKIISFTATESRVEAKVYNFTDSPMPVTIYVAKYDGDALLSCVQVAPYSIEKLPNIQTVGVDFTKEEGYTYRAFLWDDELTPLSNALDL